MAEETKHSSSFSKPLESVRLVLRDESRQVVSVNILGKEYNIISDQADLVMQVAARVNQEGERVLAVSPSGSQFDVAAQVAFRLAAALDSAERSLHSLKKQVESQAESLSRRIEESL